MKLLDTTFLIDYWGGTAATKDYLETHEDTDQFVTTTINIKELAVGRHRQGQFDRQTLESTFGWLEIVPFDTEAAYAAATLEAALWDEATTRRQVEARAGDVLIAGIAKSREIPVVTRNTDDFSTLAGVDIESY